MRRADRDHESAGDLLGGLSGFEPGPEALLGLVATVVLSSLCAEVDHLVAPFLSPRGTRGLIRAGYPATIVQLDQPGEVRAAIKRVVRAVRTGTRTTGQLVASLW